MNTTTNSTLEKKVKRIQEGFPADGTYITKIIQNIADMSLGEYFADDMDKLLELDRRIHLSQKAEGRLEDIPYKEAAYLIACAFLQDKNSTTGETRAEMISRVQDENERLYDEIEIYQLLAAPCIRKTAPQKAREISI